MRAALLLVPLLGSVLLANDGRKGRLTYLYTYFDRNGGIHIDSRPPGFMPQGFALQGVTKGLFKPALTPRQFQRVMKDPKLLDMVERIATAEGVDPWLAKAVIQAESAFNYNARSHAGAMGLMQLMPATARRFGVEDPFVPEQNITGGVKYLRWLTDFFKGDITKVVAAYNAGERNVQKHGGIPPFAETRAYVPRVLDLWQRRAVVADPKEAGAMKLLDKGRGGFLVQEEKVRALMAAAGTGPGAEGASLRSDRRDSGARIYTWRGQDGVVNITNTPPPAGIRELPPPD